MGATADDQARPLFGPDDDNAIKGEVIVKLRPSARRAITESIPTGPLRGLTLGVPQGFGIPEVDAVLAQFEATAVVPSGCKRVGIRCRALPRHPARSIGISRHLHRRIRVPEWQDHRAPVVEDGVDGEDRRFEATVRRRR